jgi:nitrate reductase beta subunit
MAAMRSYMRAKQTNKQPDIRLIESLGLSHEDIEEMYRLLAIAKYEDRFVIPASHREEVADLYTEQGSCGLAFAGGPGACGTL